MNALKQYFISSYAEMLKVTWPTKQQTINYSLLVIGLSVGLAVFFAALDFGFNTVVTTIIAR
jgi:preprotein translocase subunit SecE